MNAYIWDRHYAGAYVIVANSAQEAADIWNAEYPHGLNTRYHHGVMAGPDNFLEVKPGVVHMTEGDM